jgi:glycosyltransferase involved in cell wall biosynthesis
MRIFEIATGFTPIPAKIGAATEIVVQNLVNSLSQKHEVTLVDVKNEERTGVNCPVYEIKMPRWLMEPSSFLSLKHKLKRISYSAKLALNIKKIIKKESGNTVFHFHNQYNFTFTYWWCSSLKRKNPKIRFVYTLHTPLWSETPKNIEKTARKKYFFEIYSIKHADLVIVLNPCAKKNVDLYFRNKINNVVVIPNGVNTEIFYPYSPGKKENLNNFISIGSVCERKNQLQTIQLLHPVLKEKQIRFLFAGAIADVEYMKKIEQYISDNNLEKYVFYLGEKTPGKELNSVYNSGEVYISQSKSEAFSLVVMEALSAGLPALLSEDFKSSLETIPPNNTVFFCKSDEEFYKVINSLYTGRNVLNELSSSAREYIMKNFSWEQIAGLYEKAFTSQESV